VTPICRNFGSRQNLLVGKILPGKSQSGVGASNSYTSGASSKGREEKRPRRKKSKFSRGKARKKSINLSEVTQMSSLGFKSLLLVTKELWGKTHDWSEGGRSNRVKTHLSRKFGTEKRRN